MVPPSDQTCFEGVFLLQITAWGVAACVRSTFEDVDHLPITAVLTSEDQLIQEAKVSANSSGLHQLRSSKSKATSGSVTPTCAKIFVFVGLGRRSVRLTWKLLAIWWLSSAPPLQSYHRTSACG